MKVFLIFMLITAFKCKAANFAWPFNKRDQKASEAKDDGFFEQLFKTMDHSNFADMGEVSFHLNVIPDDLRFVNLSPIILEKTPLSDLQKVGIRKGKTEKDYVDELFEDIGNKLPKFFVKLYHPVDGSSSSDNDEVRGKRKKEKSRQIELFPKIVKSKHLIVPLRSYKSNDLFEALARYRHGISELREKRKYSKRKPILVYLPRSVSSEVQRIPSGDFQKRGPNMIMSVVMLNNNAANHKKPKVIGSDEEPFRGMFRYWKMKSKKLDDFLEKFFKF